MDDVAAIQAAVAGVPVEPEHRTNDHALHDHELPAIVRGFLAINMGTATETLAIREAGFMPKLYADHQGEAVRVVMVSRLGDVGIAREDVEHGYFARVSIYDLANYRDEMYATAPGKRRAKFRQYAITDRDGFWVRPWSGLPNIVELLPSNVPYLFPERSKAHRLVRDADRYDLKGYAVVPLLFERGERK